MSFQEFALPKAWWGPPLFFYSRRTIMAGELPNTPGNLVRWIENPPAIEPGTAMPNLGVSDSQARDMAAYLYTLRSRREEVMRRLRQFVLLRPVLLLAGCATSQSTSNTHGPAARSIAHLSHAMTITFLITTVVMWLLLAIALKKRRGTFEEHMPIDVGGGQAWIAIGGLAIPLLVLSIFFFFGLELLSDFPIHGGHGGMDSMDGETMAKPDILIMGHQWWWGGPLSQRRSKSAGQYGQ